MSNMKLITFEPLDSLFFRESKPFNAGEGGFLDSQFPPPAQTLSGAIRGAIGEANTDWNWSDKKAVAELLGTVDDPTPLSFAGPYLLKNGQRLYPVPLNFLYREWIDEKTNENRNEWVRLVPSGSAFKTDMGDCFLPEPPKKKPPEKSPEGAKPVEEGWLDAANMQQILNGNLPTSYIPSKDIFIRESRAGIGRDNRKGVVNIGQLYFTRHLRLREGYALGMAVGGATPPAGGMVRLGGEGRLARIAAGTALTKLAVPTADGQAKGLILTLLTHGDFGGQPEPDWSNEPALKNVHSSLIRVTACVGKPAREGGWDYASRRPKALKSLVPAGSCYFFEATGGKLSDVIIQLRDQHKHIGRRTAFGYGEIAVGLWK